MKVDTMLRVPLDGSLLAEMALPTAIELLRDNPDATLILLRAAEATTLPGRRRETGSDQRRAREYQGVLRRQRIDPLGRVIVEEACSKADATQVLAQPRLL